MQALTIKHWAEEDRPREKLLSHGTKSLSDAELLAILIGSGTRNRSALELAREILRTNKHSIDQLSRMSVSDLQHFKGIGRARAVTICAAMELSKRQKTEFRVKLPRVRSSSDAFRLLQGKLLDLEHEEFHVIFMNRGNAVICAEQISKGGLSGTVADGKLIFHRALQLKASSLILAHNHPSGQLRPSEADLKLTRSMVSFGNYIDLKVLDHLILCDNDYFSFADEGLIQE